MTRSLAVCAVLSVGVAVAADTPASRRDAATAKQKLAAITAQGERPSSQPRRTLVSESEVNSYILIEARDQIPTGVVDPYITILGNGRVSAHAVVDLDAVRKQKNPTSLLDPMNYLMGRLPVTATGTLRTSNGVGRFELESTAISRVPVPKLLLQEIVSYYSRTAQNPAGFNIDDSFELPLRIREIQVERGQAIIVQ